MDWASEHSINVFEEGMLVHPTLGKTFLHFVVEFVR